MPVEPLAEAGGDPARQVALVRGRADPGPDVRRGAAGRLHRAEVAQGAERAQRVVVEPPAVQDPAAARPHQEVVAGQHLVPEPADARHLGEEAVAADVEAPAVALDRPADPADDPVGLEHRGGDVVAGELARRGEARRTRADDDDLRPSTVTGAGRGAHTIEPTAYRASGRWNQAIVRRRPSASPTCGSHPSAVRASVMSGRRTVGSSSRPRDVHDLAAGPGQLADQRGQLRDRHLVRVADVHRPGQRRAEHPQHALDQVVDVLDGAGLAAVAGDREGLAGQRLPDERGHGAPVVRAHPGAVGVEDPHDRRVDAAGAPVGHGGRLGEALRLVVDPARADRVDVPPVGLGLRVHLRVAVRLGGRREQEARLLALREVQGVQGADRPDAQRLDRQPQVVERGGGRGEVQHRLDGPVDPDDLGDVGADQFERPDVGQVHDVRRGTGRQVVEAEHGPAVEQQAFTQVRTQEPGAARDDRSGSCHPHRLFPRCRPPTITWLVR